MRRKCGQKSRRGAASRSPGLEIDVGRRRLDQSAGQTDVRQENNVGRGRQPARQRALRTPSVTRAAVGLGAVSSLSVVVGRWAVPGHFLN